MTKDTDPLMWWTQHQQEFPRLVRMTRQYLTVPSSSVSPERLLSSVGLVKSDVWGSLLDTTLISHWATLVALIRILTFLRNSKLSAQFA